VELWVLFPKTPLPRLFLFHPSANYCLYQRDRPDKTPQTPTTVTLWVLLPSILGFFNFHGDRTGKSKN